MISVETARVKYTGATGRLWQHRALCMGPAAQKDYIRTLSAWCRLTWGEPGELWIHTANVFYFQQADSIVLFKLRWHGQKFP